ncbi:hypothetical protein [Phenylobacterium sp.]|uniref:hypothetical protein n=1 Tax=Phenylobacterium sp. TaxID=1871053 RepID=UPI0025CFC4B7|nr:hypothetical protein [Phenylobacterium sp.]
MKGARTIAKLRRIRLSPMDGGDTLHFQIMGRDRPEYLSVPEVPPFEGEEAWFELERIRGPVWMTWKVLRQTTEPQWARATSTA